MAPDGGLHRLFESHARQAPDARALVAGAAVVSYGELEDRANRLARHLLADGLTAGDIVAVLTRRQPDLVVAMLAALKAGGAYTVIDPDAPMDEIGRLLAVAGARIVVTDEELRPRADDGSGRPAVAVDTEAEAIAARAAGSPDAPPGPLAAVLFTAGVTGVRRPVPVSHARLRAAYAAWAEVFRLDPADVHLVTAPPDSAGFTGGWVRALCSGAALDRPGTEVVDEGFTVLDTDPATAGALLESHVPASLRLVAVSGERLAVGAQVRQHGPLAAGARLINIYGTAEVAGCGTWFETDQLPGPEPAADRVSLLGRPFPGCRADVRRGEIWLTPPDGGDAVRSGDQGRLRADGLLEFRGRRTHRVTVGGRTVDPYQAEAVLAAQPDIREAVIADAGGELAAYVVPAAGSAPGPAEVRAHLRGAVPDGEIPETVVTLDALPRNRAGQVDRRELPRPPVGSVGRGGKGGAAVPSAYLAYLQRTNRLAAAVVLAPVAALAAALLTGVLWPGSTDLNAVPQPWAGLFTGLYVAEWLAFGLGVAFLVVGRGPMLVHGRSAALTTVTHLAVVWLLVAWWPQDNLYRLAAKDDWPQQAALVYGFNVTLMVAALIVAIYATRPAPEPS